ncbi:Hypothetical protein NCS54_00006800 [Fusarium falciforme]|uniref:Hypothetical protein n=1 Tax=Fusarium falciforme TaxID=195108 RepID=UPI0023008B2B|nr:Hypothetical protein NCS54_00006800 [Fusarium falciforme]WAO82894.1 Hypothetical protein NCS54_00006800 [Fusarium falciforme]
MDTPPMERRVANVPDPNPDVWLPMAENHVKGCISEDRPRANFPLAHAESASSRPSEPPPLPGSYKGRSSAATLAFVLDGQELLRDFCTLKQVHLPFLMLDPEYSAATLRDAKPFLWLCIVAVSVKSTLKQQQLYGEIRSIIANSMVVELERSLELLQGLLVCIAWGNFQVKRRPFLTLFIQLSTTIIFDLGLNKAPPTISESTSDLRLHQPWTPSTRTSEERRAVLACYFLSSVISSYLHQADRLCWTSEMSKYLEDLADEGNGTSNLTLLMLVKIRRVLEKAYYSPADGRNRNRFQPSNTPPSWMAEVIQADLDRIKAEAVSLSQEPVVLSHLHYATFAIHEFVVPDAYPSTSSASQDTLTDLYVCLRALESYFNILFTYQPAQYTGFSLASIYQLMHSALSFRKIARYLPPESRGLTASEPLAFKDQRICQNLRRVASEAGVREDGPPTVFTKLAAMLEDRTRESESNENDAAMASFYPEDIFTGEFLDLIGPYMEQEQLQV